MVDGVRSAYAARVGQVLDLRHCRVVQSMQQDGLYLYKRPVVGTGGAANILSQAGSIFHHILLLVKHQEVRSGSLVNTLSRLSADSQCLRTPPAYYP